MQNYISVVLEEYDIGFLCKNEINKFLCQNLWTRIICLNFGVVSYYRYSVLVSKYYRPLSIELKMYHVHKKIVDDPTFLLMWYLRK